MKRLLLQLIVVYVYIFFRKFITCNFFQVRYSFKYSLSPSDFIVYNLAIPILCQSLHVVSVLMEPVHDVKK